ncbi:MAG: hypothetical protein K1X81_05960 [Bacteroidia bacterium]|nr:hypothetical protein [Bacteroidia bacterium]
MHITSNEFELISNKTLIEQKQAAITNMVNRFHQLAATLRVELQKENLWNENLFGGRHHKVTKGENFHGFPFVVLDTPQLGGGEIKVALRTLFWWGHHFSCQFIITKENFPIDNNYLQKLTALTTQIYTGEDMWEQNLLSPYFKPVEANKCTQNFLKLGMIIPLSDYEKLEEKAVAFYSCCLGMYQAK